MPRRNVGGTFRLRGEAADPDHRVRNHEAHRAQRGPRRRQPGQQCGAHHGAQHADVDGRRRHPVGDEPGPEPHQQCDTGRAGCRRGRQQYRHRRLHGRLQRELSGGLGAGGQSQRRRDEETPQAAPASHRPHIRRADGVPVRVAEEMPAVDAILQKVLDAVPFQSANAYR